MDNVFTKEDTTLHSVDQQKTSGAERFYHQISTKD